MIFYVNGYEWGIVFVPWDDPHLWFGDGFTLGVTDRKTHTVFIANDLDLDKLFYVLKHELCHVFVYSYQYDLDIPDEECLCQIVEVYGNDIDYLANNLYRRI